MMGKRPAAWLPKVRVNGPLGEDGWPRRRRLPLTPVAVSVCASPCLWDECPPGGLLGQAAFRARFYQKPPTRRPERPCYFARPPPCPRHPVFMAACYPRWRGHRRLL